MQTQRDLFEDLRAQFMCSYISDVKFEPYKSAAKDALTTKTLSEYPLRALDDAAEYFYGVNLKFQDHAQAIAFFGG